MTRSELVPGDFDFRSCQTQSPCRAAPVWLYVARRRGFFQAEKRVAIIARHAGDYIISVARVLPSSRVFPRDYSITNRSMDPFFFPRERGEVSREHGWRGGSCRDTGIVKIFDDDDGVGSSHATNECVCSTSSVVPAAR